jgi:hypothetical protein
VVVAQLANLTTVVSHLAGLFESTRQEVGALRTEVAALRQSRAAPVSSSVPVVPVASVIAPAFVSTEAEADSDNLNSDNLTKEKVLDSGDFINKHFESDNFFLNLINLILQIFRMTCVFLNLIK